ncbi:MAG: shikimate kinase [Planctomycetota bacterium]|jgi:shikimate kinase
MPPSREIIALVGLRGSGKTSLGSLLAKELGIAFLDLDDRLVELQPGSGASAGEVFEALGEPAFRDLESHALEACLAVSQPFVLATGGGVVEGLRNRELLGSSCLCIWLQADPETLCARIGVDSTSRPSLLGLEPLEEMREISLRREPHYKMLAAIELDTAGGDPKSLVAEIISKLHQ